MPLLPNAFIRTFSNTTIWLDGTNKDTTLFAHSHFSSLAENELQQKNLEKSTTILIRVPDYYVYSYSNKYLITHIFTNIFLVVCNGHMGVTGDGMKNGSRNRSIIGFWGTSKVN